MQEGTSLFSWKLGTELRRRSQERLRVTGLLVTFHFACPHNPWLQAQSSGYTASHTKLLPGWVPLPAEPNCGQKGGHRKPGGLIHIPWQCQLGTKSRARRSRGFLEQPGSWL